MPEERALCCLAYHDCCPKKSNTVQSYSCAIALLPEAGQARRPCLSFQRIHRMFPLAWPRPALKPRFLTSVAIVVDFLRNKGAHGDERGP